MPDINLIEFLSYVAPGFIAIEIFRSKYPVKSKGEFYALAWALILGIVIVSIVRWIDSKYLGNGFLVRPNAVPSIGFLSAILSAGVLVGLIHICLFRGRLELSWRWPWFRKNFGPDMQSIWNDVNQPSNKDWAVVFLDDGGIYLGWITNYTFNPNNEDHDFLLNPAKRVDEKLKVMYEVSGRGVYLNTRNVKRIEFVMGKPLT